MKTVDYSNKALGMALSPDFGDAIQQGVLGRFEALCKGLFGVNSLIVKLHGCVITRSSQTYSMTAGAVYYNGKIYTVDAFNGVAPSGQIAVWSINNTYTQKAWYGDDSKKDTFYDQKMTLTFGASGTGLADYNQSVDFDDRVSSVLAIQSKIDTAVAALVNGSPGTLDTLNELAAALGDDPNFATTIANSIATKLSKSGGTMTGAIAMSGNKITGMANGTNSGDAVNKGQMEALNRIKMANGTNQLITKVLEIGDWNMDADSSILVYHNSPWSSLDKIRHVDVVIRNDSNNAVYNLYRTAVSVGSTGGSVGGITSTYLVLYRIDGGNFDSASFSATGYNRGWITITYNE